MTVSILERAALGAAASRTMLSNAHVVTSYVTAGGVSGGEAVVAAAALDCATRRAELGGTVMRPPAAEVRESRMGEGGVRVEARRMGEASGDEMAGADELPDVVDSTETRLCVLRRARAAEGRLYR